MRVDSRCMSHKCAKPSRVIARHRCHGVAWDLELKWEHSPKLGPAQGNMDAVIAGSKAEKARRNGRHTLRRVARPIPVTPGNSFGFFRYDYSQRHGDFANVMKGQH